MKIFSIKNVISFIKCENIVKIRLKHFKKIIIIYSYLSFGGAGNVFKREN